MRKLLRIRQHVRQRIGAVGNRIDVEAYGSGDVTREEFGLCIALHGRQIVRTIDNNEIRGTEACGKPVGRNQPS